MTDHRMSPPTDRRESETKQSVSGGPHYRKDDRGDMVCEHGMAADVHCCHCHSGFIFDKDHECPDPPDVQAMFDAHPEALEFHRYTITAEGASNGYFRLVEDSQGAWVTWAEVEAYLKRSAHGPVAPPITEDVDG